MTDSPQQIQITGTEAYTEMVALHLSAIYQVEAGCSLIEALVRQQGYTVAIVEHPLMNQCGAMGNTGNMNKMALELFDSLSTQLGPATKAALNKVPGADKATWLADRINDTPNYELRGLPATTPHDLGVTREMVEAWLDGQSIWQDFDNEPDLAFIKNAIIVALYPFAESGAGCSSMINYSLGELNPLNIERPPAIGLAHELVHAYYNMRGEQPGFEVENGTTVLFEYRCVGLGPFADPNGINENAIRRNWQQAFNTFEADDHLNIKQVASRDFYSARPAQ